MQARRICPVMAVILFCVSIQVIAQDAGQLFFDGFELLRSGTAKVPALDTARLWEITQVRVALESLAARHASQRMNDEDIDILDALQAELAAARRRRDYRTYLLKNEAFHFAYYQASAMPNLVRHIESLWLQSGPYLTLLLPAMRGIDLHAEAIDAARRRDANAAAAAIAEDITRAAQYLAELISTQNQPLRPADRNRSPPA